MFKLKLTEFQKGLIPIIFLGELLLIVYGYLKALESQNPLYMQNLPWITFAFSCIWIGFGIAMIYMVRDISY